MTTPDRKRGFPFPPSPYGPGHELPLPSDMNSHTGVVEDLQTLWMVIKADGIADRDVQKKVVDLFFDSLDEKRREWLEGDDPHWGKPRAGLVKERALQRCQLGKHHEFLKQERILPLAEIFRGWISKATGS